MKEVYHNQSSKPLFHILHRTIVQMFADDFACHMILGNQREELL